LMIEAQPAYSHQQRTFKALLNRKLQSLYLTNANFFCARKSPAII
jgi:hypothetical protein